MAALHSHFNAYSCTLALSLECSLFQVGIGVGTEVI